MKKGICVTLLVLTVIMITQVSAEVYFSQVEETYNLGDLIDIEILIDPVNSNYLLEVDLVCSGIEVLTFNNYPNENGIVKIIIPLNFYTLEDAQGKCYFLARYPKESEMKSNNFEISRRLDVEIITESFYAKPGETIVVEGTAHRLNGIGASGTVEVSIPLLQSLEEVLNTIIVEDEINNETEDILEEEGEEVEGEEGIEGVSEDLDPEINTEENSIEIVEVNNPEGLVEIIDEKLEAVGGRYYGKINNGSFKVSIKIPKDIPAGDYRIDVLAYEKSNEQKTSEGIGLTNLQVIQVLKEVDVAIGSQNINPGEEFNLKPMLLDQTGIPIDDEVSVVITDNQGERIFEKVSKSHETLYHQIPTNMTSGYYRITALALNRSTEKTFFINEKARVEFELDNESLTVINIGNIPYQKSIEIALNGKPFVKDLELMLGEEQTFKLTGAGMEYDVKISDGETEINEAGIMLTGHAVGVTEKKDQGSLNFPIGILWILLIVVLIIIILFLSKKYLKKASFTKPKIFSRKSNDVVIDKDGRIKANGNEKIKTKKLSKINNKSNVTNKVAPKQAEQVLVVKGKKDKAAVLVLKIKNKISEGAKSSLEEAIRPAYENKGSIYEHGDNIFIVFSSIVTKTFKNEVLAARVAERIVAILKKHNEKFQDKINFGIGISSGEVTNNIENNKLKFTALGNFITVARRLADQSDEQIIMSKEAYEPNSSEIRGEIIKLSNGEVYHIRRVLDSKNNNKFIENFMQRQNKE